MVIKCAGLSYKLYSALHCVPQKRTTFETVRLEIKKIDFDEFWLKCSQDSRIQFACFSIHVGLLDAASKFALFTVSGLKDVKLIRKQTYMKTETYKLYSRVLLIFLPNFIKIDLHNFELYRFKVGAFLETQCIM